MDCHNILVMTDHPDPRVIVLEYQGKGGTGQLVDVGTVSLHDRIARHAEFCNTVTIDPTGSIAVVSCYVGKLRVLVFQDGTIEEEYDVMYVHSELLLWCARRS